MKTSEVLERAHEVIETDGWIQNKLHTNEGYCAIGALIATNNISGTGKALQYLTDATHEYDIVHWNNNPVRTKEEVLDAFMAAAKLARNKGD